MKRILLCFALVLCGCSAYSEEKEDYNYIDDNTIRFIRDDIDINGDYVIRVNDINGEYIVNDIIFRRNDKIEIIIDNYDFCIYCCCSFTCSK